MKSFGVTKIIRRLAFKHSYNMSDIWKELETNIWTNIVDYLTLFKTELSLFQQKWRWI